MASACAVHARREYIVIRRGSRLKRITSIPRTMPTLMFVRFQNAVADAFRSDEGQGLTEYALILALIAIVAIAALTLLGHKVTSALSTVGSSIST